MPGSSVLTQLWANSSRTAAAQLAHKVGRTVDAPLRGGVAGLDGSPKADGGALIVLGKGDLHPGLSLPLVHILAHHLRAPQDLRSARCCCGGAAIPCSSGTAGCQQQAAEHGRCSWLRSPGSRVQAHRGVASQAQAHGAHHGALACACSTHGPCSCCWSCRRPCSQAAAHHWGPG